jgi:2-polyprenyl-6-methoxyphenol hydroxylase-like FAD-dependent oxidoreductase
MAEHGVAIVGAGPTGMMLAAELSLAGVEAVIVERRDSAVLAGSRAGGLHARTIEVLDQRGVAGRFLAEGQTAQVAGFDKTRFDISDFPTRHPYGLALWQNHIERIMAGWIDELGVPVLRGREVTGFVQDGDGVDVALAGGSTLRARYLVGCDGGRSRVRKAAGIGFPGWEASVSNLIAEVELAEEPQWGVRRDAIGTHGISRLETGTVRVMVTERERRGGEATLDDLREGLIAVYRTDFGVRNPTWVSRFTDAARQADAYRRGRVLLAGDAAHIHYPAGGQGLNIGMQDAVNLGWKLALAVRGRTPEGLLDTYHAERHPVAARVLKMTLAQVALRRPDARTEALGEVVAELLAMEEPAKRFAGMMSGLDIRYGPGGGHPLLGRRMPDLDLATDRGPARVFEWLHRARPVLINFGKPRAFASRAGVPVVDAQYAGPWELPVVGTVSPPQAVLVRPDGYVAWVGEGTQAGLSEALSVWFGEG